MKKKILSIIDSLDLKSGGPSHSLVDMAIANKINNINHDILYIGKKIKLKKNTRIKIISLRQSYFKYGFSFRLIIWLLKNKKKYDLFIIHGIWQFITVVARFLLTNKYLIFTHGMLDPYFGKENFKTIKKKIYWKFIEKHNLLKSKFVLTNSRSELIKFKNTFVKTDGIKIKKINYGIFPKKINIDICKKKFLKKFKFVKNRKVILYISRIDPKKGCDLLIKAFSSIKDKKNYILLIAGNLDNEYAQYLFKVSKVLDDENIYFIDFLKDDVKYGAILYADCTILPSHGENFGVSVVESLSLKTPVICSNKVGISNIIKKYNSGLISQNNIHHLKFNLEKFFKMNLNQKKILNKNAFKCFNENFNYKNNHSFSNWIKKVS